MNISKVYAALNGEEVIVPKVERDGEVVEESYTLTPELAARLVRLGDVKFNGRLSKHIAADRGLTKEEAYEQMAAVYAKSLGTVGSFASVKAAGAHAPGEFFNAVKAAKASKRKATPAAKADVVVDSALEDRVSNIEEGLSQLLTLVKSIVE